MVSRAAAQTKPRAIRSHLRFPGEADIRVVSSNNGSDRANFEGPAKRFKPKRRAKPEGTAGQRPKRRLRRAVDGVLFSSCSRVTTLSLSANWSSIGFPLRRDGVSVVAFVEPYDDAGGAAARADAASACSRQHVMAAAIVPAHQIGLDGPLTEHHRHRILDVSPRVGRRRDEHAWPVGEQADRDLRSSPEWRHGRRS
jgi:hypothetical protein